MPMPSRTPGLLVSRRPGQSKATSASQIPLPASVVSGSACVSSATKMSSVIEEPQIGQSVIPKSCAFRGAASSPSRAKISSLSQAVTPSQTCLLREHPPAIAELPSITEPARSQTPKGENVSRSIIRLSGGRTMVSTYTKPEDVARAQKQLSYATLLGEEKVEQDIWANEKGKDLAPCPNNLSWARFEMHPGYRCSGGMHYIPDMLIAEGVPGLYTLTRPPVDLIDELTPHPMENIPEGYFGVVRPERRCPETGHWMYPPWSAGRP